MNKHELEAVKAELARNIPNSNDEELMAERLPVK